MVFSLGFLGVALTIIDQHHGAKMTWTTALCVTMVIAYAAFFSIGLGPITWVYSSEIFPLKLRAQGCGMGVGMNRVVSGVLSMTFISLYKAITMGGAFFLYGGIAAVAWVFFYTMYPETQGRTLEDMEVLFGKFHKWREANAMLETKTQVDHGDGNNGTGTVELGTKGPAN